MQFNNMNRWWRRVLVVLTIGGGFLGLVLTVAGLFGKDQKNIGSYVILITVIVIYGYGIFAGVRLSEQGRADGHLVIFYVLQVPCISSPSFTFHFFSGFQLTLTFSGGRYGFFFNLGSEWQIAIHQMQPWLVGVNVFALIVLTSLYFSRWWTRRRPSSPSAQAAFL